MAIPSASWSLVLLQLSQLAERRLPLKVLGSLPSRLLFQIQSRHTSPWSLGHMSTFYLQERLGKGSSEFQFLQWQVSAASH